MFVYVSLRVVVDLMEDLRAYTGHLPRSGVNSGQPDDQAVSGETSENVNA